MNSLGREIRRARKVGRDPQPLGSAGELPDPRDLLEGRLVIPVAEENGEELERSTHHERGLYLARQDRWDELGEAVRRADQARMMTSGGMAVADLLAYGARADAMTRMETEAGRGAPCMDGLTQLEMELQELPQDYGVAVTVALAHIDAGWAWRGTGWTHEVPPESYTRFRRHFDRAEEIVDGFDPFLMNSASLASVRCALLAGLEDASDRVADDFEDLIDLDPANPRHMRSLGYHLLPRWFGSFDALEEQAGNTAERTADIWGSGGYAWTWFDALAIDPEALAHVDAERFLDGLTDILVTRSDQYTANLLAAFTGSVMAPSTELFASRPEAEQTRAKLHEAFGWILRNHIREVHPLVWADAMNRFSSRPGLPDRETILRHGHARALTSIAHEFQDEAGEATRLTVSSDGIGLKPELHPS